MKKIICLILFTFIFCNLSAQDIPDIPKWINYGMTENSIKTALGVNQDGFVINNDVVVGVYLGRKNNNLLVYCEDKSGTLDAFINKTEKLNSDKTVIYNFVLDPNNRLVSCMIFIKKDFREILEYFNKKYGKFDFYDYSFVWTKLHNPLPISTGAVAIKLEPEDGKLEIDYVRITYYLVEK